MKRRLADYLKPGRFAWSDAWQETDLHADRCIVCGRMTKSGTTRITVELTDGGDHFVTPQDANPESNPGYMGAWVVGSECSKDIPSEYRMAEVKA